MKRSLLLLITLLLGCSFGEGSTDIQINLSALSAADVNKVTVTITGSGMSPITKNLNKVGSTWKGTIGAIPVGTDRVFSANAFDASNTIIYTGQSGLTTITKNNTTVVLLTLQQVNAPPPFNNAAPFIDSFTASSIVIATTDTIDLSTLTHDPNGDPVTFAWTASTGTFSSASAASTQWTAPNVDGTYTINFAVTDNKQATNGVSLQVQVADSNAKGKAQITAVVNTWPEIILINASPAQIDVGQTTQLALTTNDPDGDALAFLWSADCAGSFNNAAAQNPSFMLAAPLPVTQLCALSVVVTDGKGGSNSGSFSIVTGPATQANIAPQVDLTFQSEESVLNGQQVLFQIDAHDPEGTPLSFSWSSSSGSFSGQADTTTFSEITWTAPECTTPQATIDVTITDGAGLITVESFAVDIGCACGNGIQLPGELCYSPQSTIPVGTNPNSVVSGDFNSDGHLDFAVANFGSNSVMSFLGSGVGGFSLAANIGVDNGPQDLAVGLFNADTFQDLAIAHVSANNFGYINGTGTGAFPPTNSPVFVPGNPFSAPQSVAVGHFADDADDDIVTANQASNTVTLFFGNGNNTFNTNPIVMTGDLQAPVDAQVGDLNGDGFLDIAAANQNINNISMFFGNGAGTFVTGTVFVGVNQRTVEITDLNNDGKMDVVAASNAGNVVIVLLGQGIDQQAQMPIFSVTTYPAGTGAFKVLARDYNGDGIKDLAVTNFADATLSLYAGVGDGTFQFAGSLPTGAGAALFEASDFNEDGVPDFIVPNRDASSVSVILSNP